MEKTSLKSIAEFKSVLEIKEFVCSLFTNNKHSTRSEVFIAVIAETLILQTVTTQSVFG
jgi:hypothetical protein